FSGPVADAIEELSSARVAVVPVLAGSGTRLKIIEAWAAGTAVVSTPVGAEGLPGKDGDHLLMAGDPETFERSVSVLLATPTKAQAIAERARQLYEKELTWEAAWQALEECGTL
ncbi:MAG TPA: glycosyltransferase family 4 protein, partial [Bryobacteraceae bacterium]|nr:glycosyltransferase family 4 protein [Bryobacteraceae bacterium]